MKNLARKLVVAILCCFLGALTGAAVVAACQDGFAKSSSWRQPDREEIQKTVAKWLVQCSATDLVRDQVNSLLEERLGKTKADQESLDVVFEALTIMQPELIEVGQKLRFQRADNRAARFENWTEDPGQPAWLRDHVRLYLARWLAQNEFYDEALEQFGQLDPAQVLDPATLLFYRGLMEHQLLKRQECLSTMSQLLENESQLPRRFAVLAKLMSADLQPLETDSLDEIARIMNDIRRRTELHRSGKTVRRQEQDVIEKLDKLIEELESQQQQQQVAGSDAPGNPMEDSNRAGGSGDGEVASKKASDGGDWGDVPPAERAAALAEMVKSMPPHYRAVIEEYFRQLAKEKGR